VDAIASGRVYVWSLDGERRERREVLGMMGGWPVMVRGGCPRTNCSISSMAVKGISGVMELVMASTELRMGR